MNRRHVRTAAAVLIGLVLGLALAGCVPDRPGDAAGWLRGQAGVISSSVLVNHDGEFQSSGISRGELDPKITDAQLSTLIDNVQAYLNTHDQVSIRLGRKGIDFSVSTDDAESATAEGLWSELERVPNIATGNAWGDNSVKVRVLRADAVSVLADLDGLGADVAVEALTDAAAIADDTEHDDFFADFSFGPDSLGLHLPVGCTPTPAERRLAESFFAQDEIGGGALELCRSFDLYFIDGAAYSSVIPALYGELADADLLTIPVTAHQAVGAYADGHLVTVTPGDPAGFGVLSALEAPGGPAVSYVLDADRNLEVTEYGTPTADLLALVSASPTAAALPSIRLVGADSTIDGTLAQLPDMLTQVTALAATSDIFGGVELGPTTGSLSLESPVATDPDVVAAAAALRASGAWVGRAFRVSYIGMGLTIVDGVAAVDDPGYTDPHVVNAFVAAWNATAG